MAAVSVHPPRMARWKKPFRSLTRWFRKKRVAPQGAVRAHVPDWMKVASKDTMSTMFLSVVPGLGHVIQGRFREVRWSCLAWLMLVLSGLFLYGGGMGFVFLGLAIGLHAWIGARPLFKELFRSPWRAGVVVGMLIALVLIYRAIPGLVLPDLTAGRTSLTVPYQGVQPGDYLLAWRSRAAKECIGRGSLVLAPVSRLTNEGSTEVQTMIVQVIGLGGETLEIKDGVFIVDGRQLDTEKYPVPNWLRDRELSVKIGDNRCFVSSEYHVSIRGRGQLLDEYILRVCVVRLADIEARAFILWLPLRRRAFLKATE